MCAPVSTFTKFLLETFDPDTLSLSLSLESRIIENRKEELEEEGEE